MGDLKNIIIMAFIILAFSIPGVASAEANNSSVVKTLYAGQDIEAGTVTVSNDCDYVNITYRTNANWSILETHLAVADSLDGIPMTKSGNPIPGQFEFGNDSLQNGTNMTEFVMPLPAENGTLYIAAHAAVRDETNNSSTDEGAWAEGSSFPGKNWATYFTYEIQACEDEDESGSPADDGSNNDGNNSESSNDDSSSGDNDSDSSNDDNSNSSSGGNSSDNGDSEDPDDNDSSSDDGSNSSGDDSSSNEEDDSDPSDDDSSPGDEDDSESSDDDSPSDNDDDSSSEDNGSEDPESDDESDPSDDSSDSGDSENGSNSSGDSPGSSDNGRSSKGGSGGFPVAEEAQTDSESDDNERAFMAVDAVEEKPEAPVTIPVEEPESSNPVSEIIPKLSNTLWFIIWTLLSAICVMSGYGLTQP